MNAAEISEAVIHQAKSLSRGQKGEALVAQLTRIHSRNWRKVKAGGKYLPVANIAPTLALIEKLNPKGIPFFNQRIDGFSHFITDNRFEAVVCKLLNMTDEQREAVLKQLN